MKRVKPLKFRFLGFGKYPKCKKHHIPLVYVDDQIGELVSGALACLFDKTGLPPNDLLTMIASKYPDESKAFVHGWLYCITAGRGAPIVSRYLDSISNTYLKKLSRKQVKSFKKDKNKNTTHLYQDIKNGLKEITKQYTRLLKHLRVHSEVIVDHNNLVSLSRNVRNYLKVWQKGIIIKYMEIKPLTDTKRITLIEIKHHYDQILNVGTCRCLIGMNSEIKKVKVNAFDRFSAYMEFFSEKITEKFSKSDINKIENFCEDCKSKVLFTNSQDNTGDSFQDSLSLKDKLYEEFGVKKEDIKEGRYIPNFEEYRILPKFKGLTKKNFINIRNEWFKEILHKNSFVEYRIELNSKAFFQDNEELFNLIQSNQYPEGTLIYNLIQILDLSLPKLEKAIYGTNNNNIKRQLQKLRTFNWEGLTTKIKRFIILIEDEYLRQKAVGVFQKYLKNKVYNGFRRRDFPKIDYFTLEKYPEGWLILYLCEINLISDTKLGKLIDYKDLPYHLTELRGFKGKRINKLKIFLYKIVDKEKKEKSFKIFSNYIEYIVFSQLNREKVENIEEFLDSNPKKWLVYKLCVIYLIPIRDFGKEIDYEDLKTTVHTHYDFSDIVIRKIRNFINKTEDNYKKDKAREFLSFYLKRSVYLKLKQIDLPKYSEFKIKMHPALWLIIQICSIYLLHPFEIEKSVKYKELSKRLKSISYFTNITLTKFKNFFKQNGKSEQYKLAMKALNKFVEVRNKEFQRFTGTRIQNLNKLAKFPELVSHLEYISKLGTFPDEILEGYHEYPRISQFNQQFRFIEAEKKRSFIKKMISSNIITDKTIHKSINALVKLSKNKYFKPSEIYPTHKSPSHESVLNRILKEDSNSIGIEIPIWMWHKDHYLTGHIDLILFIDDTIYVCDYKPEETPHIETNRLSYSFMRSIPQVASYALVLKKVFEIETILCVTFNNKGVWIYEPKLALKNLNNFIKKNKQYKVYDRPWEKYFLN